MPQKSSKATGLKQEELEQRLQFEELLAFDEAEEEEFPVEDDDEDLEEEVRLKGAAVGRASRSREGVDMGVGEERPLGRARVGESSEFGGLVEALKAAFGKSRNVDPFSLSKLPSIVKDNIMEVVESRVSYQELKWACKRVGPSLCELEQSFSPKDVGLLRIEWRGQRL